jgi:hypothetical protein
MNATEPSKTPLTDKIAHRGLHESAYCCEMTACSRAIELRLSECVEALELCKPRVLKGIEPLYGEPDSIYEKMKTAITNARKPL